MPKRQKRHKKWAYELWQHCDEGDAFFVRCFYKADAERYKKSQEEIMKQLCSEDPTMPEFTYVIKKVRIYSRAPIDISVYPIYKGKDIIKYELRYEQFKYH